MMKTFLVGAETITVRTSPDLEAAGAQGLYADADGSILIAGTISKEAQESAFCEELTHCLLSRCGRPGLNEDHTFVRPFSAFLYQVLKQGGFFK